MSQEINTEPEITEKDRCKAYIQIIPDPNMKWDHIKILDDNKTFQIPSQKNFQKFVKPIPDSYWSFVTDGVLINKTQQEIYKTVTDNLLESAIAGNNVLIIGYGQTGTGKSVTLNGVQNHYEDRGIVLRLMKDLFKMKEKYETCHEIEYKMSFIEIFTTQFMDLLSPTRECNYMFDKATKIDLISPEQGWDLFFHGEGRRSVFRYSPYYSHSASALLTIFIKSSSLIYTDPNTRYSKICIVDMIACDHIGTPCPWKTPFETGVGNFTRSQFEQFLHAIRGQSKKFLERSKGLFVEYLNMILKPPCIIRFIGHIRMNKKDVLVTKYVLKLTQLVRNVKPKIVTPCTEKSETLLCISLKKEIDFLNKQIELDAMLKNSNLIYNISDTRYEHMQNVIEEYINNKNCELSILNIADAVLALRVFRDLYNSYEVKSIASIPSSMLSMTPSSKEKVRGKSKSSIGRRKSPESISVRKAAKFNKIAEELSMSTVGNSSLRSKSTRRLAPKSVKSKISGDSKSLAESEKKFSVAALSPPDDIDFAIKIPKFPETWKQYVYSESYSFESLHDSLSACTTLTRDTYKEYCELYRSIQQTRSKLDLKNVALLKLKTMREINIRNVDSCFAEEEAKLESITSSLYTDLNEQKEKCLTAQADLLINLEEYQRIKKCIAEDFRKYCVIVHNIELDDPPPEEKIEEILNEPPIMPCVTAEEVEEERDRYLFYKLKKEMNAMIEAISRPQLKWKNK